MSQPDPKEVAEKINEHLVYIARILAEVRDELQVRAVILDVKMISCGGPRAVISSKMDLAPNLPGVSRIERELGLVQDEPWAP